MTARFLVGDVFDRLAEIPDGSVDLVVTSPPFLALRSYLPADHPDKGKEIGSEATPAEFIDTMLRVTQVLRRVLAPHGSIAVELGDTYSGSGGSGGDYNENGMREGQARWSGSASRNANDLGHADKDRWASSDHRPGWPLAKSLTMIPESYRWALTYGLNPFTGVASPTGLWRARNIVRWVRPNPAVGYLSDKWRPGTSDLVVACTSDRRYWDDLATRRPSDYNRPNLRGQGSRATDVPGQPKNQSDHTTSSGSAPLLDWWSIAPGGFPGAHYAVFPPALVEPCVKAMTPPRVCRTCGEPSRRITETTNAVGKGFSRHGPDGKAEPGAERRGDKNREQPNAAEKITIGWSDCGHDDWRPGLVLDPFAGSGTTLLVATGYGHDAIGIDLDERNAELAMQRVGPFLMEVVA